MFFYYLQFKHDQIGTPANIKGFQGKYLTKRPI